MRLILVGDAPGIAQLLRRVPAGHVVALVGWSIRSQYLAELEQMAARLAVPVLVQPRFGSGEFAAFVNAAGALQADLIWVNSYSMILGDDLLATARLGGINIHAALLPRNWGCNPIQWAIIHGETEGGVTLHEITAGIAEGPIIDQRRVPIDIADDWLAVRDRIAGATDDLIAANLPRLLAVRWTSVAQDAARASYGRRRTAEDERFDRSPPVIDIHNRIRALVPSLPPAFHVDAADERVPMTERLTPQAVAGVKYGAAGGGRHAV